MNEKAFHGPRQLKDTLCFRRKDQIERDLGAFSRRAEIASSARLAVGGAGRRLNHGRRRAHMRKGMEDREAESEMGMWNGEMSAKGAGSAGHLKKGLGAQPRAS
jgi:hypothetical protein